MNVNTLSANFTISRSAVYKHIKLLRESGLLVVRPRGRERFCVARLDKLSQVMDWLHQYARLRIVDGQGLQNGSIRQAGAVMQQAT